MQIPVGFLVKRKPKPGVEYEILGVGFVVEWQNGYFTIEGVNNSGDLIGVHDATRARASSAQLAKEGVGDFDVTDHDLRQRQVVTVAVRRGQAKFRAELLKAYEGRCCVTGCDLTDALEAAHISTYRGQHSNHPQNGLLLRADIHTLFDLGLISFDGANKLVAAPSVSHSLAYQELSGTPLRKPREASDLPSAEALRKHREWTAL
ncbi:HNH endonuclease [uncultured Sulfitobacter sp.]|uniref:HNH endonuclease n=1 Tax=uncultured Sulfitobacter sp. TaxID=191468 RepID=UPI0030F98A15